MPKVRKDRATRVQDDLAQRIAAERKSRGWTQDRLARAVTAMGSPMILSTVYKIENGTRRCTIDELVAFGRALGIDPGDLLLPIEFAMDREARKRVRAMNDALSQTSAAVELLISAKMGLLAVLLRGKDLGSQALDQRVSEVMPSLTISYPMGSLDEEDDAPDPVSAAWSALDAATTQVAQWEVSNVQR
jgi:transcriptional regulator with XRE-family HTH domain